MKKILAAILAASAAAGCSTVPTHSFTEVPARRPAALEVTLTHRIADAATVAAECAWRNRVAGNGAVRMHPTNPACSWTEPGGRRVVLCTNPESFNNALALEACGHEAFHFHEIVDHR